MRSYCILLVILISTGFACNKNKQAGDNEYVTLSYQQTLCADPWTNANSDSLTLVNVANYLTSSGLYIAGLNLKQDSNPEMCSACVCKTGKTIFVSTLNSETLKAKYLLIGFK